MIVFGEVVGNAVGDSKTDGEHVVAHDLSEAVERGGLHLKIGDLAVAEAEGVDFGVEIRILELCAHGTALRSEEARGAGGHAFHHVESDAVEKIAATLDTVRIGKFFVPTSMRHKGLHHAGRSA